MMKHLVTRSVIDVVKFNVWGFLLDIPRILIQKSFAFQLNIIYTENACILRPIIISSLLFSAFVYIKPFIVVLTKFAMNQMLWQTGHLFGSHFVLYHQYNRYLESVSVPTTQKGTTVKDVGPSIMH